MQVYIASLHCLAALERPYEESVGLGSYMDQKAVVLSKNEGDYLYQSYGRSFDKEDRELGVLQISVCHYSGVFYVL